MTEQHFFFNLADTFHPSLHLQPVFPFERVEVEPCDTSVSELKAAEMKGKASRSVTNTMFRSRMRFMTSG